MECVVLQRRQCARHVLCGTWDDVWDVLCMDVPLPRCVSACIIYGLHTECSPLSSPYMGRAQSVVPSPYTCMCCVRSSRLCPPCHTLHARKASGGWCASVYKNAGTGLRYHTSGCLCGGVHNFLILCAPMSPTRAVQHPRESIFCTIMLVHVLVYTLGLFRHTALEIDAPIHDEYLCIIC